MSTKRKPAGDAGPPITKRQKVQAPPGHTFSTAAEIHSALQTENQEELTAILISLRNKFTTHPNAVLAPQDDRLVLAKSWMDAQPGARDVFSVWETSIRSHTPLQPLAIGILAALLNLLSAHFIYHSAGWPIVKALLSPTWMRRLNTGVGSGQNDTILSTLKLLNAVSDFGGGRERATLLKVFNWSQKSLPRLLSMRRKGKPEPDPLARPDIRTLYIFFLLSFLAPNTPSPIKTAFLEDHRDAFWSIFRGLHGDPYPVLQRILELCWDGLWQDQKVKRTLKVSCFTETTLNQIIKLYDVLAFAPAQDPADLAHHFLLAICSHPGVGVCFRDRGWYPRERDGEEEEDEKETVKGKKERSGGKVYNKLLASIVRGLKVNEDARQQELALRILAACPELVAGYWPAASLTLEARLASKWIVNMAFVGSVVALALPTSSFLLPGSTSYNPSPPPLSIILENVLPTNGLKQTLTKGLASPSPLVQHTAALTLARCLEKLDTTLNGFADVSSRLEEGLDGQWTTRQADLLRMARQRLPELQVVVAFALHQLAPLPDGADESQRRRVSLLSEVALRVIWLYHRTLPELTSEARFDVGKLLVVFTDENTTDKVHRLRQLHVLRTLTLSDQFVWSSKLGSTGRTHLHFLLKIYVSSPAAIKSACLDLLQTLLGPSVMFSHDATASELPLWLASLPCTVRSTTAVAPHGLSLSDERAAVLEFLDDCVLRCTKTPYRYLEDVAGLAPGYAPSHLPSPLLGTLLEQLAAPRTFEGSDSIAIFAFVRKLAFALAGRQPDLRCAIAIAQSLRTKCLLRVVPQAGRATEREVENLETALKALSRGPVDTLPRTSDERVEIFLVEVERNTSTDPEQTLVTACELLDWYRLVDIPRTSEDTFRLYTALQGLSSDIARELLLCVPPGGDAVSRLDALPADLQFSWAFTHTSTASLDDAAVCRRLAQLAVGHAPTTAVHATQCILHRLATLIADDDTEGISKALKLIVEVVRLLQRRQEDVHQIKLLLFVESREMQTLCRSGASASALQNVVRVLLDVSDDGDRVLVGNICDFWAERCSRGVSSSQLANLRPWVPFMRTPQLLQLLRVALLQNASILLGPLCGTLSTSLDSDSFSSLLEQIPELVAVLNVPDTDNDCIDAVIRLVTAVVSHGLPHGYDGLSAPPLSVESLDKAWQQGPRAINLPTATVDNLVNLPSTLLGHAELLSALIYRCPGRRQNLARVLTQDPDRRLLPVMHAILDTTLATRSHPTPVSDTVLNAWQRQLVSWVFRTPTGLSQRSKTKELSRRCILLIAELQPERRKTISDLVEHRISKIVDLPTDVCVLELVDLLLQGWPKDFNAVGSLLVDNSLRALVRHFVEVKEDSSADDKPTRFIVSIAKHASAIKIQFVEPFMVAAIQYRLAVQSTMELAHLLVKQLPLKPANTNRYLQSIIQHPSVLAVAGPSPSIALSPVRLAVAKLLHTLFHKHPSNACQPSHMGPLLRIYGGTLTLADRLILANFFLYEQQRGASAGSFLVRWTASPGGAPSSRPSQALASMDGACVFRSTTPTSTVDLLQFDKVNVNVEPNAAAMLYDPIFVAQLFGQCLLDAGAYNALEWVELFRSNAASVAVCMLSYREASLRQLAFSIVGNLWVALKNASFQERDQTMYILDILRDTMSPPAASSTGSTAPPRLPMYATLLLAHALRGLFHPSAPIYPIASRFLLQRPALDIRDVPLLYGMLYSASVDGAWRKEQSWILRFLADGTVGELEWRVLRRRHTWDLIATIFGASVDPAVRWGILQVLANLTCIKAAATSLLLRSQLLAWLELQVRADVRVTASEDLAWVRILENIACASQPEKLQLATAGEWRTSIARCVAAVVKKTDKLAVVLLASRTLWRLVALSTEVLPSLVAALSEVCQALKRLEPPAMEDTVRSSLLPPPHRAAALSSTSNDAPALYAEAIELAWQTAVTVPNTREAWTFLTPRLLALPRIQNANRVVEWARRSLVSSLR